MTEGIGAQRHKCVSAPVPLLLFFFLLFCFFFTRNRAKIPKDADASFAMEPCMALAWL
jgi:hypothetical protein